MPNGYTWQTLVRITPKDGPSETINLSTGFLDGGSSRSVLTKAEPRYIERIDAAEDINSAQRPRLRGYECEVMLRFELADVGTHHPTIARIMNRLMSPYWTVELSLNNGVTYREVVLRKAGSPRPFGDKTVAGFKVEHVVVCRELLDTYPDIGSGTTW